MLKRLIRSIYWFQVVSVNSSQSQQYQMITEKTNQQRNIKSENRMLRIIKQQSNGLIVSNGIEEMLFKRYVINDEKIRHKLQQRFHLRHQSLIQIYNIEYSKQKKNSSDQSNQLDCGILLQKYTKTMEQSIKEMVKFTHQEVIETFTPIKDVIDYFTYHHYDPGQITYASIVCNEQYQTKLIDPFFHSPNLKSEERDSKLYEQLAQMLFCLLFPQTKHKSWKFRYEMAEQQLEKIHFHFFQEIYKKFATPPTKSRKSKTIKKQLKQKGKVRSGEFIAKNDSSSAQKKSFYEPTINAQQGKQNLIIQ